jgi:hypothetical protein
METAAPDDIVEQLRALPAARVYVSTGDAWRTLHTSDGPHVEEHRF